MVGFSKLFFVSIIVLIFSSSSLLGQQVITGKVLSESQPISFAHLQLIGTPFGAATDSNGNFIIELVSIGDFKMLVTASGYFTIEKPIKLKTNDTLQLTFLLKEDVSSLSEVVVSGSMKEVSKLDNPVPVEVYSSKFFQCNPTPSIFDALQNINGVRPQLNCNICNTGDIHINGLEGPYTMVLIDGMPIVSGLSTVYGLSGIPQSLIDRVEIVKGPASTLYGSEAVGGLINIITKSPNKAPAFSLDVFGTHWGELSTDLSSKIKVHKNVQTLIGLNYYNYSFPIDHNQDNFTDVTLQNRISVFNKWSVQRNGNRLFTVAGRYVYETRWGGEMQWAPQYRGGDQIYGESIYTKRWELFGTYQLPFKEKIFLQLSANNHDQDAAYGIIRYIANQKVLFGQLYWNKPIGMQDLLIGLTYRYTYYDDNTPATAFANNLSINHPSHTHLPGVFIQDELQFNSQHKLLLGLRYDFHSIHGNTFTPRLNYKWTSPNRKNILRAGIGNGYRVAHVFTEDHAALTGAREVVFTNELKPETSWNGTINYVKKISINNIKIGLDASLFYTYFTNKIIPDFTTDPNKIIYDNLDGYAISQGVSLNLDIDLFEGLKILAGATFMDVSNYKNDKKQVQYFSERISGVWTISYEWPHSGFSIDYTGNVYGPMQLPLISTTDPRPSQSPWWSIQNIQLKQKLGKNIELYGGVKNLLNWTPNKNTDFIIARAHDPFDKGVIFDSKGKAVTTPQNPYGLTFDPTYMYAPNQGIRGFLGLKFSLE